MVINFCTKSYMTTLFIKYSQENMCLQKSLLKGKVGFNHVEMFLFFPLKPTTSRLLVTMQFFF